MAGRSFAQRQAQTAREANRTAPPPAPPTAVPTERPQPPRAAPIDDLEEDFDLGVEPENGDEDEVYYEEEESAPADKDTPSRIYSTRRALAEQVNKDVGDRSYGEETTGLDALRDRREAWKKMVRAKEQEGRSPYLARWAKVSFFPFLYMIISLQLLRSITYEYAVHYDYNSLYLVAGLVVGLVIIVSFAVGTMLRARRSKRPVLLKGKSSWFGVIVFIAGSLYLVAGLLVGLVIIVSFAVGTMLRARRSKRPVLLKGKSSWFGVIVFIGGSFYLAWVYGLSYAWQFSIGFLGAGLLVVVFGFLIEKSAKGTFWIKDPTDKSDKRWLEFIPQSVEG